MLLPDLDFTEFSADLLKFGRVVTVVRTREQQLKLQTWAVSIENDPIEFPIELVTQSLPNSAGDGRQISLGIANDMMTTARTVEIGCNSFTRVQCLKGLEIVVIRVTLPVEQPL